MGVYRAINSEEDYEDIPLDDPILSEVARLVKEQNSGVFVADQLAVRKIEAVYKLLKSIVVGKDLKFDKEVGEVFITTASIGVSGKEITITNPKLLANVLESLGMTNNPGASPYLDGIVEFGIGFQRVAQKVAELPE